MSRKYRKPKIDWREFVWPVIVTVIISCALMIPRFAWGATYDKPIKFTATNGSSVFDTAIYFIHSDTVLRDSLLFTSFPVDTFVTLSSDTSYEERVLYSYTTLNGLLAYSYATIPSRATATAFSNAIHPFRIYATSGTDTISSVYLEFSNATGTEGDNGITNSAGFVDKTVPTGTINVVGSRAGFVFNDTSYSVTADDTVAIVGTAVVPGTPAGASVCRLWGWASDLGRGGVKEATVTATISPDSYNLCDSTIPLVNIVTTLTSSHADSLGYWQLDVVWSSCLGTSTKSKKYKLEMKHSTNASSRDTQITVPDSVSHQVFF